MRKLRRSRPSPALVIAVLALAGAVAGTAIAGPAVISALTAKRVKKIARKVSNRQITKRAPGLTVEDAKNVNGISIRDFFAQAPPNTTDAVIGTFGPVTLKATCQADGDAVLRASWSEAVAVLSFDGGSNGGGGGQFGAAQLPANTTANISGGDLASVGRTEAIGVGTHRRTTIAYSTRQAPTLGVNQCSFAGMVSIG